MKISSDIIQEVRQTADLVDIVSGFVRLKKIGKRFLGLCPFHQEKTPSFNVDPDKGLFKCFGCGKGGDVFAFVMETEKGSFSDAVVSLAERYNIRLEEESEASQRTGKLKDDLYEIMREAARFYHNTLNSPEGTAGSAYFAKRGWQPSMQRKFGLGVAPNQWEAFLTHARKLSISEELLDRAGLVIHKDQERYYDRFRNRVMFPIFSASRKVIGFGARAFEGNEEPKYLNSPETPIYNKSKILYGLPQAANAIRSKDEAILVEGYADVLTLSQSGIENVVCSSGTALTADQVQLLMRYSKNILFLYDGDSAGVHAMVRGIDVLVAEGCDPRIVALPVGEDPDSLIHTQGAGALTPAIKNAMTFLEFLADQHKKDGKLETPQGKAEAVRSILDLLAKMDDAIKREFYLRQVSETYGVYENVLYQEFQQLQRKGDRRLARSASGREQPLARKEASALPEKGQSIPRYEAAFLTVLFQAPEDMLSELLSEVNSRNFTDARIRTIVELLLEQREERGRIDLGILPASFGDDLELHGMFSELRLPRATVSERWKDRQTVIDPPHQQVVFQGYGSMFRRKILARIAELHLQHKADPDDVGLAKMISDLRKLEVEILKNGLALGESKLADMLKDIK